MTPFIFIIVQILLFNLINCAEPTTWGNTDGEKNCEIKFFNKFPFGNENTTVSTIFTYPRVCYFIFSFNFISRFNQTLKNFEFFFFILAK